MLQISKAYTTGVFFGSLLGLTLTNVFNVGVYAGKPLEEQLMAVFAGVGIALTVEIILKNLRFV